MKPRITAVIITKNEESMIANCIETLRWCNEVLVIDTGSQDHTVEVARKLGATIHKTASTSFADRRNIALKQAKGEWLFYIDADERVTPLLAQEIIVQAEVTPHSALAMHRENMMYGQIFLHGGWEKEIVVRAFRRSTFQGWQGEIHESPIFDGQPVQLHTSLLHLTHRNTADGLRKTIEWTPIEAKLLFESGIPPVTVFTIFRKGIMEVIRRAMMKGGKKDGVAGWVEAIIQGINRMLVYIQVWELQQQPSLADRYADRERQILSLWKNAH